GGISVVSLPGQPNTFQITFGDPGDQPMFNFLGDNLPLGYTAEMTPGAPGAREVQRFTVFPNVPAGVNNNPPAITSQMQITFGASKTTFLPATTSAQVLENTLNA